jgi:DNA-binding MarR family transcriptional regulator
MRQDVMEMEPATAQHNAADTLAEIDLGVIGPDDALFHNTLSDDATDQPVALFADELLQALAAMAMRSKRRQADLCAALCRARLDTDPRRVTDALRQLERSGCIEHLVPLYDGGVLMSVTSRGIEKLNAGPRWNMLDGAGFLRG